ncbi:MAG: TylF/MycF/NovP-related O-methyltransferase [Pseudomonadota bacterium]
MGDVQDICLEGTSTPVREKAVKLDERYGELLARTISGYVYPESAFEILAQRQGRSLRERIRNHVISGFSRFGYRLVKARPFDEEARATGTDWPYVGFSMVGLARLRQLRKAVATIVQNGIPGDFVECGVWRGGCVMMMAATLSECGDRSRSIWAADSFEGLPVPDVTRYPADAGYDLSHIRYLAASVEQVKANFDRTGIDRSQVRFLKGWFRDTLPNAPIGRISILRLDGDLYESTRDALTSLYDRVAPGGFVIIDDYYSWPPCRKAVDEFRAERCISAPLVEIDNSAVFWRV